jgi:hypothetical protein
VVSNVRINLTEEKKAGLTAIALAQHCLPGEGALPDGKKYLVASTYAVEFVEDGNGLWKVESWKMKVAWAQGDPSIMKRAE